MAEENAPLLQDVKVDVGASSSWEEHDSGYSSDITKRLSARLKLAQDGTPGIPVDISGVHKKLSISVDIFKGILVVLMTIGHTMITMCPPTIKSTSTLATFCMNACSSQCFGGFMMAFGFSCYGGYLKSDAGNGSASQLWRVMRTCAVPVCGAWICSFAWAFLCFKVTVSKVVLLQILTFYKVYGNGPDFLLTFSINLAVTYLLWKPMKKLVSSVTHPWNKVLAVVLLLCPICLSFCVIPDCSGLKHYINFFLPCRYRGQVFESPNLPALPYLFDFGLGVLAALATEEWVGNLTPQGTRMILPWAAVRCWSCISLAMLTAFYIMFLPLKNIFWQAQLGNVRVKTEWGWMIRGFEEGPSMLWLLSTVWPIQCWMLVSFLMAMGSLSISSDQGSGVTGGSLQLFKWFAMALEHLGANVLFYLVVADVFLAGLYRANSYTADPYPFDALDACWCGMLILLMGRFIHYMAATARK